MRRHPPTPLKVGRPGITDLPLPSRRFNLTLTPGFETVEAVGAEDRLRARMLRRRSLSVKPKEAGELLALADAVDPDVTRHPTTSASARYMRAARVRIIGQLWALIDARSWPAAKERAQVATFTLIPAGSSIPLGQLGLFNVILWLAAFRQHLIRSARLLGIKPAGFLFACVHGAYDRATQTYPMHIHGLATGDMIAVVDGLRRLRIYRPAQPFEECDRANVPVWISRKPLTNMPDPLTYIMKRFWARRETYLDIDGLRKAFDNGVQRIPEPAHSEVLQFLDAWRLEDMTLLVGLTATQLGLVSR